MGASGLSPSSIDGVVDRLSLHELGQRIVSGVAEMSSFIVGVPAGAAVPLRWGDMGWWLSMVAEFDRRQGWAADGARSCSHWLSWKCGLDGRTARAHVRVATQLVSLPVLRVALAEGRLSYSKVRTVCRVATADNEEFLAGLATNLTATQLEGAVAAYGRSHGEPLSVGDDAARRARCGVRSWFDDDGLHHTEIVSPPEDGALLDLALEYGRDERFKASGAVVRGPEGRLDSLLWVLRQGLVNAERPGLDDDARYTIVLHLKEAQAFVTDEGRVDLGNGVCVHPRTLQRLGCDGMVQAMLEGLDGRPLDLGRQVRTASRKQRRALKAMYDRCQFPGCDVGVDYREFHHLDWWTHGGRSDLHVFRPLCRRHHHLCHEGGWRLVVADDGSLTALPPHDGAAPVVNAPALTDTAIAATALVEANRVNGHVPVDDALDALTEPAVPLTDAAAGTGTSGEYGRWGAEPMDDWALSVIVEHMLVASGVDLLDTTPTVDVDTRLVRGSPPSPN